jgi:phage terminase large subunit-like protein
MTRGERVIAFIEKYCRVPSGKLVGQPIKLDKFQQRFIKKIYDNKVRTRLAILSMARKNGKTALIAGLCLAHIVGPEARLNSQLVSGAMSRDQAALVFDLMVKMINFSPELQARSRVVPSGKKIYGLSKNVEYQALAAEAKTKHGLSPWLVIFDELGQVRGPKNDFVEALETAQGAYDDAMQIVISTQAPTDADMLSIWIDDAISSGDPHTVIELHTAPEEANLMNERAWKKANPALGTFRSEVEMRSMAEKAILISASTATPRSSPRMFGSAMVVKLPFGVMRKFIPVWIFPARWILPPMCPLLLSMIFGK